MPGLLRTDSLPQPGWRAPASHQVTERTSRLSLRPTPSGNVRLPPGPLPSSDVSRRDHPPV